MNSLLVTVDSLRYDHLQRMENTTNYLDTTHEYAFATCTATLGSFPAIVGGEYADGPGLHEGSSVGSHLDGHGVGITTNQLLSQRYGYHEGFDSFTSPTGGGDSPKERAAVYLTQGSVPYRIAAWGWNKYQRLIGHFREIPKSFRPAEDVVDQFLEEVRDEDHWFGWLHFMEPHHPYDPNDSPVDRAEAQRVSRRVLGGQGDEDDFELVCELYRREVEELDAKLARLWDAIPDDTRVVFCADHGELLGEDGLWGHPGEMRPELLHVPFGTRNAPALGDVVSLIDVPTVLRGEPHGQGTLNREVAFAAYGDRKAAMNATHIATDEGTFDLESREPASDPDLESQFERFEARSVVQEDAVLEDLEALGYA